MESFGQAFSGRAFVNLITTFTPMNDRFTPSQALVKIRQYCAYQERCHSETRDKLFSYGLNTTEADEILCTLIDENFINEERFAMQYAGGKFRLKHWGRQKIVSGLKQKRVSDYCIRKALQQIDEEEYKKTFKKLADKKRLSLKGEKNIFIKKSKIRNYLRSKGYDYDLINQYLND